MAGIRVERRHSLRNSRKSLLKMASLRNEKSILKQGLSLDLSPTGIQLLSNTALELGEKLEVYIPVGNNKLIPIEATVQWSKVEENFLHSPYWVQAGLALHFHSHEIRNQYVNSLKN